jgi:hypothetical protein
LSDHLPPEFVITFDRNTHHRGGNVLLTSITQIDEADQYQPTDLLLSVLFDSDLLRNRLCHDKRREH